MVEIFSVPRARVPTTSVRIVPAVAAQLPKGRDRSGESSVRRRRRAGRADSEQDEGHDTSHDPRHDSRHATVRVRPSGEECHSGGGEVEAVAGLEVTG